MAVGLELNHILYALIIAVIAYVVREVRRRRYEIRPKRPDMRLEEAWRNWLDGIEKHPDQALIPSWLSPKTVREPIRRDVHRSLAHLQEQVRSSDDHERHIIRRMILSNATLALVLGALIESSEEARMALIEGYEAGMSDLLEDAVTGSILKWVVLREYARGKFDDAVTDDWFHQYHRIARPYVREKVRLAKNHVLQADARAGRFAAIYDTLLGELRDRSLKTRPKRRFPPPDLP